MCQPADLPRLIAEEEAAQMEAIQEGFARLLLVDPAFDIKNAEQRAVLFGLYAVAFGDGADWEAARRREQ